MSEFTMRAIEYRAYLPSAKDDCLCGSGKRFKRCCRDAIQSALSNSVNASTSSSSSPEARLQEARVQYCLYWLKHKAHCEALGKAQYPLFEVDLRAMSELLEDLIHRAYDAGQRHEAIEALNRLAGALQHPEWANQLAFLRALAYLYPDWDEQGQERAKSELRQLDLGAVRSPEVIELSLDLLGDELGLSRKLSLLEYLCNHSETPGQRLQYGALRAILLYAYDDSNGAKVQLARAIGAYSSPPQDRQALDPEAAYSLLQYGKALALSVALDPTRDDSAAEAESAFSRLLADAPLNPAGIADVEFERAYCLGLVGRWQDALKAYEHAQGTHFTARAAVAQADCLMHLGRTAEAKAVLLSLDYASLPSTVKADFCLSLTLSELATKEPCPTNVELHLRRLSEVEVIAPLFRQRVEDLRQSLWSIKHELLETELCQLRAELKRACVGSSAENAMRLAIAAHRDLPPQSLTRALPLSQELPDYLVRVCTETCSKLVEQRQLLTEDSNSREDTYTAFLTSLLQQRVAEFGWTVGEQELGGLPSRSSPERGRRDLVFRKQGDVPFAILEAVRCKSLGPAGWGDVQEHLQRALTRYDPVGASIAIVVVYAEVSDFQAFTSKYIDHLCAGGHASGGPSTKLAWKRAYLLRKAIALYSSPHVVDHNEVEVTHLIVHLSSSRPTKQ